MSAGQEFWIVAAGCTKSADVAQKEKDAHLADLKRVRSFAPSRKSPTAGAWALGVPDGQQALAIGSFDTLIRLTDDLQKNDQQIDSLVHRLERQMLELDPKANFTVKSQGKEVAFMDYIQNWQWDEHKFSKTRTMAENVALLMQIVSRLDEETRNKAAAHSELKTQKANLAKKEGVNLTGRDLVDVLTPNVVKMRGSADDDFVLTEHLTTVCVILPRSGADEFLAVYESMAENIVPRSARKFVGLDDKDGNQLWRVVMFRSAVEGFKKACREKRCVVRDFEYDQDAYKKLMNQREEVDAAESKQKQIVGQLFRAAWSDAMVAWVHVKAMRTFVECVLRFGMQPHFASFIVSPVANTAPAARKALSGILGKNAPSGPSGEKQAGDDDEGEEYFPYVSQTFTPFVVPRA